MANQDSTQTRVVQTTPHGTGKQEARHPLMATALKHHQSVRILRPGFSIVTYTGDGTGPDTVGHGLSSAPELIIVKNRSSVYDWKIYNETIGNTKYLSLNTSDAEATASTNWNDTSPTASVFYG